MGLTRVTVSLKPLSKRKKAYESLFLVDTSAIDCVASAKKLKKIGVEREGLKLCELGDGSHVELAYGFVRVSFMGMETVSPVLFSNNDAAEPILGVLALEGTGIAVDPKTNSLKKLHATSLKKILAVSQSALAPRRIATRIK
jgi:predicted aspartyl protease